jgi:hypothetical protein
MPWNGGAGDPDHRGAAPPARRRRLIALGVIALIAGGTALVLVLSSGEGPPSPPSSTRSGPTGPNVQPEPSPPWGFTATWLDYCYRRLSGAPGYRSANAAATQPCPPGDTRFTAAEQIALTAQAGATADRLPWGWGAIEPSPPRTEAGGGPPTRSYVWGPFTRVYRTMLRAGIRPVVMIIGSPEWARRPGWDRPSGCAAPPGRSCAYPPSPSHLGDWRAFVGELLRRFPQMRALEVWSEPNSANAFAPHPSPARYAQLLRAAAGAARASGSGVPILTGGLAPMSNKGAEKVPPDRFLTRVYRLAGKRSFDGIAIHPYPAEPPWSKNMTAILDQVRRVRDRFHDRATPLWITEIGIGGTARNAGVDSVPPDRQGRILVRLYHTIQASDVRSFIIYTLRDVQTQGARFEPFGVMRANLEPKPAYCYVARQLGGTAC